MNRYELTMRTSDTLLDLIDKADGFGREDVKMLMYPFLVNYAAQYIDATEVPSLQEVIKRLIDAIP